MKLKETMICWNEPPAAAVCVGPHPDLTGWSNPYNMSDGAAYTAWRKYPADERLLRLFVLFNLIVTRSRVSPALVHNAFLAIDEYVEALPPDARDKIKDPPATA